MGISPSRERVGFGIEIELSGIPWNVDASPIRKREYKRAGFRALKSAMEERDICTTMDRVSNNGSFVKHPGDYRFWHLTQDSSSDPENKPAASEFSRLTLTTRYRFLTSSHLTNN